MICKVCGRENANGVTSCQFCGAILEEAGNQEQEQYNDNRQGQYMGGSQGQQYTGSYTSAPIPGKSEATTSMVLGIISIGMWFFCCSSVISIILGTIGLVVSSKAKKLGYDDHRRGDILSLIGLIGGIVVLILSVVFIIIMGGIMSLTTLTELW